MLPAEANGAHKQLLKSNPRGQLSPQHLGADAAKPKKMQQWEICRVCFKSFDTTIQRKRPGTTILDKVIHNNKRKKTSGRANVHKKGRQTQIE